MLMKEGENLYYHGTEKIEAKVKTEVKQTIEKERQNSCTETYQIHQV